MIDEILQLKDKLLNPKRGDKYNLWFYLEGWRLCEVSVGNKKCTVKPVTKGKAVKYSRASLKRELESTYWYAAKCKATPINGKRPKKWTAEFA